MRYQIINFIVIPCLIYFLFGCAASRKSKNRDYDYGWYPKKFEEVKKNYSDYTHFSNCKEGETIASIGTGNGTSEVAISCFIDDVNWYLQEIDSVKLYQFDYVLSHFEKLKGAKINADFELVLGTTTSTNLPESTFDRIIMNNVYHELSDRESMLLDVLSLLKPNGQLVIMEPMARKIGEKHTNCEHLRLWEPDFLKEMEGFGYQLLDKNVGEKISFLVYYTFVLSL